MDGPKICILCLICKKKDKSFRRKYTNILKCLLHSSCASLDCLSFSASSFPLHTSLLSLSQVSAPCPPSQHQTSHMRTHMAASHQEWVSWQPAGNLSLGSFHRLKATVQTLTAGSPKHKFSFNRNLCATYAAAVVRNSCCFHEAFLKLPHHQHSSTTTSSTLHDFDRISAGDFLNPISIICMAVPCDSPAHWPCYLEHSHPLRNTQVKLSCM